MSENVVLVELGSGQGRQLTDQEREQIKLFNLTRKQELVVSTVWAAYPEIDQTQKILDYIRKYSYQIIIAMLFFAFLFPGKLTLPLEYLALIFIWGYHIIYATYCYSKSILVYLEDAKTPANPWYFNKIGMLYKVKKQPLSYWMFYWLKVLTTFILLLITQHYLTAIVFITFPEIVDILEMYLYRKEFFKNLEFFEANL